MRFALSLFPDRPYGRRYGNNDKDNVGGGSSRPGTNVYMSGPEPGFDKPARSR